METMRRVSAGEEIGLSVVCNVHSSSNSIRAALTHNKEKGGEEGEDKNSPISNGDEVRLAYQLLVDLFISNKTSVCTHTHTHTTPH